MTQLINSLRCWACSSSVNSNFSVSRYVHTYRTGATAVDGLCCYGCFLCICGPLVPFTQMVSELTVVCNICYRLRAHWFWDSFIFFKIKSSKSAYNNIVLMVCMENTAVTLLLLFSLMQGEHEQDNNLKHACLPLKRDHDLSSSV